MSSYEITVRDQLRLFNPKRLVIIKTRSGKKNIVIAKDKAEKLIDNELIAYAKVKLVAITKGTESNWSSYISIWI